MSPLRGLFANDIINQYIVFCKVLTEQAKKYGLTRQAIEETLRICRDKNVLVEYLRQRETEIMDIMTTLFDQDYITELYGHDRERFGRKEGIRDTTLNAIKNLMTKLQMGLDEAMALLEIPKEDQPIYVAALNKKE